MELEGDFHLITYADNGSCTMVVQDYFLGTFNYLSLLEGVALDGELPNDIKLFVSGERCDLLGGPLSWLIMSQDLVSLISEFYPNDFQVLKAPIYSMQGEKIQGYSILNPTRLISCHDTEKSIYLGEDEERECIEDVIIKSKVPADIGLFRIKENPCSVYFTKAAVEMLIGKGFAGLGFLSCESS